MKLQKTMYLLTALASSSIALSAFAAPGDGGVDEFGMEDHSATCKWDQSYQHLSVADFDGNGCVTFKDINLLCNAIYDFQRNGKKGYQAFYDIGNKVIDPTGETENIAGFCDMAKANMDMMFSFFNRAVSLDQQVAAQYQFTKQYRDINQAIIDGFVPFTQEYRKPRYPLT